MGFIHLTVFILLLLIPMCYLVLKYIESKVFSSVNVKKKNRLLHRHGLILQSLVSLGVIYMADIITYRSILNLRKQTLRNKFYNLCFNFTLAQTEVAL